MCGVMELHRCHTLGWVSHYVDNSSPPGRVRKLVNHIEFMEFLF